ncbi:hypothetical protein O3M35_010481 [Rhynocoris fuscipes]|uniref:Uncharacterized protein n=1 Tax=Rhynocoris fuscipes TaxID=488301 RepID=A0AAW1D003_9HEMI
MLCRQKLTQKITQYLPRNEQLRGQYGNSECSMGYDDEKAAVRQAVAYGCGTLALYGGPAFTGTCAEVLPRLA